MNIEDQEIVSGVTIRLVIGGNFTRYAFAVPCGGVESFLKVLKSVKGFDIRIGYALSDGEIVVYYESKKARSK